MRKFNSFESKLEKLKPILFYKKKENYSRRLIKNHKYNISSIMLNIYCKVLILI